MPDDDEGPGSSLKVETIEQYLQAVAPSGSELTTVGVPHLYRGHSNAAWNLTPGIGRIDLLSLGGGWEWSNFESMMLDQFWDLAVAHHVLPQSWIERVMIAQHYGLPTRLLDWSTSPLVALAFSIDDSTPDDNEHDGRVWIYQPALMIPSAKLATEPPTPSPDDPNRYVVAAHVSPPHISTRITAQQVRHLPPFAAQEREVSVHRRSG